MIPYRTLLLSFIFLGSLYARAGVERTDTVMLEEVNVSAVKSGDVLRRSAVSSSLVTAEEMRRLGAVSVKGISDALPNFFMPDYGSRITSSMYVRGIGARMDQPAVGLTVDNVPILNKDAYDFDIPDIVSVEMLRGPQSTLYGRNTMGGQINVVSLSPLRWQGWRFMAEAANGASMRLSAGWYHRFSKSIGGAAVASFSYSDGFFRNLYNGKKVDKERSGGLRLKFHYSPSSSFSVQNTFFASLLRQGGYPYEYLGTGEINYNDTCFYRRFLLTDGLTVRKRFSGMTLTSVTSVQHINDNMTLDQDFLPLPYFTLTQKKNETSVTEDLVLRSDNIAGSAYGWLAGIFGFWRHLHMSAPVTFKDTGIKSLIESHRNEANPEYPIAWNGRSFPLDSDFKMPTWGISAYHESAVNAAPWHFTLSLRLDYERVSMDYESDCHTGYTIYHIDPSLPQGMEKFRDVKIDIADHGKLARDFLNFTPKITALYEIGASASNIYLNIAKGYKAGGFNTQMFSDVLQQRLMGIMGIGASYDIDDVVSYKPEKSWNFELGSHLSMPDGRVMADLAVFLIECRDQQLTMFPDGTTTGRIMTNAGRTRSFGAEVTLSYSPVTDLRFNASYGYTNARFVRFFNGINDFKGKYLPYVPQNTVFAQGIYTLHTGNRHLPEVEFDVNMRAAGKIYWNESNTSVQKLYALLGASVALAGDGWNLRLWGKNLTDTKYYTFYFMSIGNEFVQRAKPLQFGATFTLSI